MSRRSRKTRAQRKDAGSNHAATDVIAVADLPNWQYRFQTGDKWSGGFGVTQLLTADYWTLRARSAELFETNLYARGLIRRLVTNEINTGLHLEAVPEETVLGLEEDTLAPWTEDVETRFALWGEDAWLCDHTEASAYGALQAQARMEALIEGDVLVILRQSPVTGLPRVQLIKGSAVQSPLGVEPRAGNRICHGVELDGQDRQVAYWVRQRDNTMKRLPAFGEKSGRKLAWLVYGTERRLDEVRGKPILSLVLQSLKEIDRYRDSTQRKAVINSMLAMFIKKTQDKPGTGAITSNAISRRTDKTVDSAGKQRSFHTAELMPGLVIEELQVGEEPVGFQSHGTDEKFGDFEEAIIQAVAWANEVPPEIMRLAFSSNYSASQAAINEFKMYLNKVRTTFGDSFCKHIYVEWLIASAIAGKVKAPDMLSAWRDSSQYDVFGAWSRSDWSGHIKPAVDLTRLVNGYNAMVLEGYITRDRAARELTGTKFSKNIKRLALENIQVARANAPLERLKALSKPNAVDVGAIRSDGTIPEDDDAPQGEGDAPSARKSLRVLGAHS